VLVWHATWIGVRSARPPSQNEALARVFE
jgi:hypothetical protein